jgi:hypothetical protein
MTPIDRLAAVIPIRLPGPLFFVFVPVVSSESAIFRFGVAILSEYVLWVQKNRGEK